MDKKIVSVISGGMMGSDPYDPKSWSGSSLALLNAFEHNSLLTRAYGAELDKVTQVIKMLRSFHFDKETWRRKLYMSKHYRTELTRQTLAKTQATDKDQYILQLGAYINTRKIYGADAILASYQDGNVYERIISPFTPASVLKNKKLLQQAFEYEREVANDMDLVFTTSEYLRQSFIQHYQLPAEKVFNVNAGVNLREFNDVITTEKNYHNKDVLFIGKSEFIRKGGDLAIAAIDLLSQEFPDIKLHMVGPDPVLAEKYQHPNVKFYGFLDQKNEEDLAIFKDLMKKCSIFILPSRYEPLGIAPLESMLHKIPAIVTGEWALKENITDGVNGLHCLRDNATDLADKMRELLNDPQRLKAMGEHARLSVKSVFTWDRTAKQIFECFKNHRKNS